MSSTYKNVFSNRKVENRKKKRQQIKKKQLIYRTSLYRPQYVCCLSLINKIYFMYVVVHNLFSGFVLIFFR